MVIGLSSLDDPDYKYPSREAIEIFLRRKYVIRQDERQKQMGLSYLTAEVSDLARELKKFLDAY